MNALNVERALLTLLVSTCALALPGCGGGGDAPGQPLVGPSAGGQAAQLPVITAADLAAARAAAGLAPTSSVTAPPEPAAAAANAASTPAPSATAAAPEATAEPAPVAQAPADPATSAPAATAPTAAAPTGQAQPTVTGELHAGNYRSVLADVLAQAELLQMNLELVGDLIETPPGLRNCHAGGSVVINFADADTNGLPSVGDSYTATLSACRLRSPLSDMLTVLSGTAQGALTALQGSISAVAPYSVTMAVQQNSLGYSTPTVHSISQPEGSIPVTRTRYTPDRWDNTFGSGTLQVFIPPAVAATPAPSRRSVAVGSVTSTNDGVGTSAFGLTLDYVVSAVPFVGRNTALSVRTATPWSSSSGAIIVLAPDGSRALVERLGPDNWRTQLDADSDGRFEQSDSGRPAYP